MAGVGGIKTLFRRKLAKRELALLVLTALTVAGALVYQFPYTSLEKSVAALATDISNEQKGVLEASVRIADLRTREAMLKELMKSGVAGWDLGDQKSVLMILEDVSAEAKRQGVSLIAVHPSQELNKDKYKEVSVTLDLKGRYRELAEYFKRIESISRIVNIRKIRVEACPDSASACATQLEAVTYLAK